MYGLISFKKLFVMPFRPGELSILSFLIIVSISTAPIDVKKELPGIWLEDEV